jgi:cyclopropane fatty-acyl-phospholipid synthase-like methyltransferase
MNKKLIDKRYRAYTGPADKYDKLGALQFNILTSLGLRENHLLLDIGCGSLSAGRFFIVYLNLAHYYGVEPLKWLVEEGLKNELGKDIFNTKQPSFLYSDKFDFYKFGKKFDYIIAHSIFTHSSKTQIEKCIKEASKVMKNSSIFIATYIEGYDYEGQDWIHNGFATYSRDFMIEVFEKNSISPKILNLKHPLNQKLILGIKDQNN